MKRKDESICIQGVWFKNIEEARLAGFYISKTNRDDKWTKNYNG